MNKETVNVIFAIISVLSLLIPVGFGRYITTETTDNIIIIEGTYPQGETLGLYSGTENITANITGYSGDIPIDTPLGWDANNDTIFLGYKSGGIISDRDAVYYGNYNTYIGSGEHIAIVDWDDIPVGTYDSRRYLYIPLNYTTSEVTSFDFVRINSNIGNYTSGVNSALFFQADSNSIHQISNTYVDNDTAIIALTPGIKSVFNSYPNGTIYLGIYATGNNFNETQTSFTWSVDVVELNPEDRIFGSEYTDTALWVMMLMLLGVIYTLAFVFANPKIGATWENVKPKKKSGGN